MTEFSDIFSTPQRPFGRTSLMEHSIDTGNKDPFRQRAYKTSPNMRREIDNQVPTMLDQGLIRPSNSPYSSPLLLIRKKNKREYRVVIDFRKLNAQTLHKSAYPLPRIDDTIDSLAGNSLFTTLDFASGYFQIPLAEEDKYKTAFSTGTELHEFEVMPMGLCNAPMTFQALMEKVLSGLHLDDVLVYGKTFEEKLGNL